MCESRYLGGKPLYFKKIKQWPYEVTDGVEMEEREEPLALKRHPSVFVAKKEEEGEVPVEKMETDQMETTEETKPDVAPIPTFKEVGRW